MFEVKENYITIGKTEIQTFSREIYNANVIYFEAGTTGYCGGDSGHGGKTYIKINDLGGTDITVNPIPEGKQGNGGVEIIFGGDAELDTLIMGLKFITKVLEDQANEVHD